MESSVRTIVVVTASNDAQAAAVEQELAARQQARVYGPSVRFFAVPDPSAARVGSGGATFNALITVQELVAGSPHWSLDKVRIFMIHSGGDSQRLPSQSVCGKAWSALPAYNSQSELDAPIDLLLTRMFHVFAAVRSGLVVASSDVLLYLPPGWRCDWPQTGATGLAIPTAKAYGPNHGVYHVPPGVAAFPGHENVFPIASFHQKASVAELCAAGAVRPDDTVLLDTGVIYFSPPATATLVAVACTYPCDSCSYLGVDMNRTPLRVELYSDVMMAMGGGLGRSLAAYHATPHSDIPANAPRLAAARDVMWSALNAVPFYAAVVEGGGFSHVGTTGEYLQLLTAPTPFQAQYQLRSHCAWYAAGLQVAGTGGCALPPGHAGHAVLNSLFHTHGTIGQGSVVEHSELMGGWCVGAGCLVSAVRTLPDLVVQPGMAVQELRVDDVEGTSRVVTVLGVADPIKEVYCKPAARICGVPWSVLFETAGVGPEDVWPGDVPPAARTIWTARLFPAFRVPPASGDDTCRRHGVPGAFIASLQDRASTWLQHLPSCVGMEGCTEASRLGGGCGVTSAPHAISPDVLSLWRSATRLSLRDILGAANAGVEFAWRRTLRGRIDVALLLGAVAQGGSVPVSDLVSRLGRAAQTVTSVTDGVGTALDDVAGSRLHIGVVRPPLGRDGHARAEVHAVSPRADSAGPLSVALPHAWSVGDSVSTALRWRNFAGGEASSSALAALHGLDDMAAHASVDIAGRALAVESELLWAMAGWCTVDHRSGPAHNAAWLAAFSLLEGHSGHGTAWCASPPPRGGAGASVAGGGSWDSKRVHAVAHLARLRDGWLHRAHLIGRAARHYERAAQLLTAQCVYTAPVAVPMPLPHEEEVGVGAWASASAPARIDLAGGWSDTPPITYEARASSESGDGDVVGTPSSDDGTPSCIDKVVALAARGGGLVVNVAVRVDGLQPIGTRARRVAVDGRAGGGAVVTIRTRSKGRGGGSDGDDGAPGVVTSTLRVCSLEDLSDFCQPHAEGAIVKCVLLCLGLVSLPTTSAFAMAGGAAVELPVPPLSHQLLSRLGGGLEVETWSMLPHGSGLGGSSILSATVVAAVARVMGVTYDLPSLNHLVLKVEQMLSTGGGWQDQVGGMWPGVKASACSASLPVVVTVQPLLGVDVVGRPSSGADAALAAFLNAHLVLVYTGKTRLAKNLLQRVLRQWATRDNGVTSRVAELRANAVTMARALVAHDVDGVGASLSAYWEQKKGMAPMAEPSEVGAAIAALLKSGVVAGCSLTGAGGGGFLVVVTRRPGASAEVAAVLSKLPDGAAFSIHTATVDADGMVVKVA